MTYYRAHISIGRDGFRDNWTRISHVGRFRVFEVEVGQFLVVPREAVDHHDPVRLRNHVAVPCDAHSGHHIVSWNTHYEWVWIGKKCNLQDCSPFSGGQCLTIDCFQLLKKPVESLNFVFNFFHLVPVILPGLKCKKVTQG